MLSAALEYARNGYCVFPLAPNQKTPLKDSHGCHDGTTSEDKINEWWSQHPSANIGLACMGSVVVIDIDPDGETWAADKDFGDAVVAITPRGRHYFYRVVGGRDWGCRSITTGVDVRANGGYVVVSPSRLADGGEYHWRDQPLPRVGLLKEPPDWLVRELDGLAEPAGGQVANADGGPIPEGQRDNTLTRMGGYLRRGGFSEAEILAMLAETNRTRCSPMLDHQDIVRISRSVARYQPDQITVALIEDHYGQDRASNPKDPGAMPAELWQNRPGLIGDLIKWNLDGAEYPQPELALAGAVSLMATLTGRKIRDARNCRTNLYVLGLCPTGGGKNRARELNNELLLKGTDTRHLIGPQKLVSDSGFVRTMSERHCCLFQVDEIGKLFQRIANKPSEHIKAIVDELLIFYSSAGTEYSGAEYSDTRRNIESINQPHAVVYGTSTPEVFYGALTSENMEDGLASRLLVIEATTGDPTRKKDIVYQPLPDELVEQIGWWGAFTPSGNLGGINPEPLCVAYKDAAAELLELMADDVDARRRSTKGVERALWTRHIEKVRKLALIASASRNCFDIVVTPEDLKWAWKLNEWSSAKLVFKAGCHVSESPFHKLCQKAVSAIREKGGSIKQRDLLRKLRVKAREIEEVRDHLVATHEVVTELVTGQGGAGTVWSLV